MLFTSIYTPIITLLCALVIALFCLFSPAIVYLIHKQFFSWKKNPITLFDNMIGKTVIHFNTTGCMGQIHEFDYIGIITGIKYSKENSKFYIVDVLKDVGGEKRDNNLKYKEEETIASWYLQKIGTNLYIAYD